MLKLVEKFDFRKDLHEEVKKLMCDWCNIENKRKESQQALDFLDSYQYAPDLIGQERNSLLIFRWHCKECPFAKTFVGLYDQINRKAKLIFTEEKITHIVNATVNSDQSILAFAVVEKQSTDGYVSPADAGDIFKSYLAEIAPQNRVFSLNIEWKTYQKVQFLNEFPETSHKISHLLFFHHKESIGLYHVPVALCDKGYVMNMQPSTQQIIGHFLWSYFDIVAQRLFFVKLYPQDEEEIDAKALLTVVEFKAGGDFEYILNFPLPVSFKMNVLQQNSTYYDNYFSSIVCSKLFNMEVITTKPGSFYVCYQHTIQEKSVESYSDDEQVSPDTSSAPTSDLSTSSLGSTDSTSSINYTVCCVHGAYKVQCSAVVPSHIHELQPRVLFTPFNDYIVAFLPGCFLHLLDISCEHEPVHNLLLRNDIHVLPAIQDWEFLQSPVFSSIVEESVPSQQYHLLFENHTQKAYKFEINLKAIYKIFLYSKATTRIAILHSIMNHLTEKKLTRSIVARLCLDPANMETSGLITEYLIAASYLHMKKCVSTPLDLKVFPFTSHETFRGQVERNENGERVVHLFYKYFSSDLVRQIQKVLHKNTTSFWSNIYQYLCYEVEHRNRRFPLKLLYHAGLVQDSSTTPQLRKYITSGFIGAETYPQEKSRSTSTSSLPEFRIGVHDNKENKYRNTVAMEKIVNYIAKIFGKETKSKATRMCEEYVTIRVKVVHSFWKLVLKSLNFKSQEELFEHSLDEPVDDFLLALFQLVERCKLIFDQLCHPSFPELNRLLCHLGFRCLSRHQFQEYLEACVFDIDYHFVFKVVSDIPDTVENIAVKQKLISHLRKEDAYAVQCDWGNSSANRSVAQKMMQKIPSEAMHFNLNMSEQNEMSEDFVPLQTLLQAIRVSGQKNSILQSRSNNLSEVDLHFLASTVLTDTESLISPDKR